MLPAYATAIADLVRCPLLSFGDPKLHQTLPTDGGVYVVYRTTVSPQLALYAGKATDLTERLYRNLLHGQDRSHTLRRKLNAAFGFTTKAQLKRFLQTECAVRWVIEHNSKDRSFLEHFTIAYLRCPYND